MKYINPIILIMLTLIFVSTISSPIIADDISGKALVCKKNWPKFSRTIVCGYIFISKNKVEFVTNKTKHTNPYSITKTHIHLVSGSVNRKTLEIKSEEEGSNGQCYLSKPEDVYPDLIQIEKGKIKVEEKRNLIRTKQNKI